MQNFALAGGVLNGDPEVWIDDAVAGIAVQAAGEIMQGLTLKGGAQVVVGASLPPSLRLALSGGASMSMAASGSLVRGTTIIGNAAVQVGASGDFTRWAMLEGLAPVEVYAEGDIIVVESISATFTIEIHAEGDIRVAQSQRLEGHAPIELRGDLKAWSVPATQLCGRAIVEVASIGQGALVIQSPEGAAQIQIGAHGAARLCAKLPLEGSAVIETFARGELGRRHYVFLEGQAAIELLAWAEKTGIPLIPDHYVAAPGIRTLRLTEELRRFIVPAERRL